MTHPDSDVQKAIINLSDALCEWERSTGRQSVLIIREFDFTYRAMNGKPVSSIDAVGEEISDEELVKATMRAQNSF